VVVVHRANAVASRKLAASPAAEVVVMNRGVALYRSVTVLWFLLLIGALHFAVSGPSGAAVTCIVLVAVLIAFQTLIFRCSHCGARPGLWLLAIWTLLLDYELYIADVILLRRCPRCETVFKQAEKEPSGSGRAA